MELSFKHQVGVVRVILVLPALCSCSECVTNSRASYYSTPGGYGNPRGACGFGEYGRTMNNGIEGWRYGAKCHYTAMGKECMWWQQQRWEPLCRVYGAVFDFANPPTGQILLRFLIVFNYWLLPNVPIPANWNPGATYDTKLQLY
ncbi:Expansin-like B1, partial [Mucuna pruriens]